MDVEKILEKASDQLSVRRAFGPAYEKNGLLIIPVALVAGGGGGGMARPGRANAAAHTDRPSKEAGPADASGGPQKELVRKQQCDRKNDSENRAGRIWSRGRPAFRAAG